jgi:hypothetical protein
VWLVKSFLRWATNCKASHRKGRRRGEEEKGRRKVGGRDKRKEGRKQGEERMGGRRKGEGGKREDSDSYMLVSGMRFYQLTSDLCNKSNKGRAAKNGKSFVKIFGI